MHWIIESISRNPGITRIELRRQARERFGDEYDVALLHRRLHDFKKAGRIESYRVPGTTSEKPHGWRLAEKPET